MKLFAGQIRVPRDQAAGFRTSAASKSIPLGHYDISRQSFTDVLVDAAGMNELRTLVNVLLAHGKEADIELYEIAEVASAGSSRRGSHRLGTWNSCPQSYAYRHVLKLAPLREPAGRALGALLHIGLMNFYLMRLGVSFVDPFEAMRDAPARIAYRFPDAKRILEAYLEHYKSEVLDVLDVEREFVVKVGGHWHTQRLDLIVRRGKRAEVWDQKSSGFRSVSVAREWETSLQFLSAELIGRALFPSIYNLDFGGVVINSLGTTSTPEFSRHRLSIPGELLPFAKQTIKRTNEEIEAEFAAGTDLWKFKRTWACQGRYGICDYDSLCRRGKSALGEYDQVEDQAAEMMK